MKQLLAISTLLIPICLFAQGFGSFSHDQPFLGGGSASSGDVMPRRNLAFWWVASDLSSSPVSIWTDRIQGRNLTQATGANQPTLTNGAGINFTGAQWMELTNTINLTKGDALLVVARPMASTGTFAEIVFASGAGFGYFWLNSSDLDFNDSGGVIVTPVSFNKNYELLYAGTNGIITLYTNGVVGPAFALTQTATFSLISKHTSQPYYFNGRIEEIAIWTNVAFLTSQEVAEVHQGVTNRWIFP